LRGGHCRTDSSIARRSQDAVEDSPPHPRPAGDLGFKCDAGREENGVSLRDHPGCETSYPDVAVVIG
jgi:hypothetical protein